MVRIATHLISIVALANLLAACRTSDVAVSLSYRPTASIEVVHGAGGVTLDVVARDRRPQFKDRVGAIRGVNKRIVADEDVSDLVRGSLEQELRGQGFSVAGGGLTLTAEIQNFYCDYDFGGSTNVAFTLRLRDGSLTLYSHFYEGTAAGGSGFIFNREEGAKILIEQALAQAIKQVGEDKALQRALLSSKAPTVRRM